MCRRLELVWRLQSDHITAGVITLYNACCRAGRTGQGSRACLRRVSAAVNTWDVQRRTSAGVIHLSVWTSSTDRPPATRRWVERPVGHLHVINHLLVDARSRIVKTTACDTVLLLLLPASYLFNPDIGDPSIIHCASWYQCLLTISLPTVRW